MEDVHIDGCEVTFLYKGTCQEAAHLRKRIQDDIYNYAIEKVVFFENSSGETAESLALKFGLLIIDQAFITDGHLNVQGPKMVMTDEITGIKSVHNMPIVYLRENTVLKCDFILDKKCGKNHQKYNPVSAVRFIKFENQFKFYLELTGALTFDEIRLQLNI